MLFRRQRSLDWYLRAYALAVTLPLLVLVCFLIYQHFDADRFDEEELLHERAAAMANDTQLFLLRSRQMLEFLASRPLVRSLDPARCDPELAGYARTFGRQAANVFTLDEQGRPVCSAIAAAVGAARQVDPRYYLDRARATRQFTVGTPAVGFLSQRWVVTAALPILDEQRQFRGVVAISFDLLEFSRSLAGFHHLPLNMDTGLVDMQGAYVSRLLDPAIWVGKVSATLKAILKGHDKAAVRVVEAVDDGARRLYAVHRVEDTDWFAFVSVPAQEGYVRGYREMGVAALSALLALLLAALLAWRMARMLTRPLLDMAESFRKAAAGDLSVQVQALGTRETRALAQDFNEMVSARARAEQGLRAAERRYRQLFDNVNEGIVVIQDGRVKLANAAATRVAGEQIDATSGQFRMEWIHPEDRSLVRERHLAVQQADIDIRSAVRIFPVNGTAAWVMMTSAPVEWDGRPALVTFFWDVTEAQQAAQVLAQSERRFRDTLDAMIEGCCVIGLDWTVLYVNEAGARHARQPREALMGQTLQSRFPADALSDLLGGLTRAMEAREPSTFVSQLHYPDGSSAWLEIHVSPVPEGIFVMSLDVSQAREAQTRRMALEAQLREAQKLEAIGELTGGLAHDFNNLLGVVIGHLDQLGQGMPADAPAQRARQSALDAALRGAELTRSLLAVARRQPLTRSPCEINALIRDSLSLLRTAAGADSRVEAELAAVPLPALLDAAGFANVLLNLVNNARDAMKPASGDKRITLRSRLQRLQDDASGLLPAGDYALIEVQDSGTGMPESVRLQAFEPFFTTKERGKGTGLGLAMVYSYARQHGGLAQIESAPGQGCCVRLVLPLLTGSGPVSIGEEGAAAPAVAFTPPPGVPAAQQRPLRVLVVDDEPSLAELAAIWLGAAGHQVQFELSPQDALHRLQGQRFDLLFSDVMMPGGMDGIELARQALLLQPQLQILLASGLAEQLREKHQLAWPILNKPYRRQELQRAVAALSAGPMQPDEPVHVVPIGDDSLPGKPARQKEEPPA